jgi:hypothetical protein
LDLAAVGCFNACGATDADVFRVGILEAGRQIRVRLEFDPAEGSLALRVGKTTGPASTVLSTTFSASDVDGDGIVEIVLTTTGVQREHGIQVVPTGSFGNAAQTYALSVETL